MKKIASWGAAFALAFLLCVSELVASGSGLLSISNPVPAMHGDNSVRKLIKLESIDKIDTLFWCAPASDALALIALRVREPAAGGDIVLWERKHNDGSVLIHLSLPHNLQRKLAGVTIFVRNFDAGVQLLHAQNSMWLEQTSEQISFRQYGPDRSRGGGVAAYVVNEPGLFLIRYGDDRPKPIQYLPDINAFDFRIRMARATWHLLVPGIVMLLIAAISRRIHNRAS
jgi:hypothetical protein